MPIPHIIHQMWLDRADPTLGPPLDRFPTYKEYMASWKIHNPTFNYHLWNGVEIRQLWADPRAAKWASLPNRMRHHIELCDISRYLLELLEGGIYADLDFLNQQSLIKAIEGKEIILVNEPEEHEQSSLPISNGIMASAPGHPFWALVLDHIDANYETLADAGKMATETTGPFMLAELIRLNGPGILEGGQIESACDFIFYTIGGGPSKACESSNPYTVTKWNEGTGWPIEYDQTTPKTATAIAVIAILILVPLLLMWMFNRRL